MILLKQDLKRKETKNMVNNVALFFLVIIVLVTISDKIECKKNKNEKMSFFLINHDITEIVEVPGRSLGTKRNLFLEKISFQFTAFENTFVLDLTLFYPREDSKIDYISKLSNATGTFLNYRLPIFQGYVRNINHSFVLGYFGKNCPFKGYVITDEIFCIEPYDSSKVIVYRFKDVITPGCSKKSEDEDLDCSETRYFVPWKANNPPAVHMPPNYELLYNKYFKFHHQQEAKRAELKRKSNEQTNGSSRKKHHNSYHRSDNKDVEGREEKSVTILRHYNKNKGSSIGSKTEDSDKTTTATSVEQIKNKKKNMASKIEKYSPKRNEDEYDDDGLDKTTASTSVEEIKKQNETSKKEKHKPKKKQTKGDNDDDNDHDKNNIDKNKSLKDSNRFSIPENTTVIDSKRKVKLSYNNEDLLPMKKEPVKVTEKHEKHVVKRELKSRIGISKVENLETDPTESLQCNVQVMIAPSWMTKFDEDTENILRDVIIQFTLLNKIFLKLPLQNEGKTIHFFFHLATIVMFDDDVYSPFTERADLEHFTKYQRGTENYCLSIGLANQYLKSGEFFDGYIPTGKGGICSKVGNTLIVSHGNERTPAPMALFFASLVRGITRAMGANDMDEECEEGSFPNPMQVLQDYLLSQEIVPPSSYSILTTCSIKEIEATLKSRNCFFRVSQPLCGNAILDPGEECDCGPLAMCGAVDPCCNSPHLLLEPKPGEETNGEKRGCTLIKSAKCSNLQECCINCEILKSKETCFSGPLDCDIAECDGASASCPTGVEASNGMICSNNKTLIEPMVCKDNICDQNLCSSFDLKPCTCAFGTKRECVYCCEKDGKCQAAGEDLQLFPNRTYFLPKRTECMGGTCQRGVCMTIYGEEVIYNETESTPRLAVSLGAHSEFSILYIIMGTIFPFLIVRFD